MDKKNNTINRDVSVSEFQIWKANSNKTVSELRESITKRVGGQYLPRALSNETRKRILLQITNTRNITKIVDELNHIKVRSWIAEGYDFNYNGNGNRHYGFLKEELQRIEFKLQQMGVEKQYEIETENPDRWRPK